LRDSTVLLNPQYDIFKQYWDVDDSFAMSTDWENSLLDRLIVTAHPNGGWGYSPGTAPCAEPTSLACLVLSSRETEADIERRGLALLSRLTHPDGSVSVALNIDAPCWTTGLAVLAWFLSRNKAALRYRPQIEKARDWLLHARGKTIEPNPTVYGHDTTLTGWSWVENTHAWVEPTAYAILALRAVGQGDHPRVQEGIQMVLDRAIPGGGWNYGNPRVYGNTLRPFPGPTGIALTALAGQPSNSRIEEGIAYLSHELRRVRAPMSLAWGLIGLTAWGRRPDEAAVWLEECAKRALLSSPNAMYDALLLLADFDPSPIITRSPEVATNG